MRKTGDLEKQDIVNKITELISWISNSVYREYKGLTNIELIKLWSGAQNNFSISPKLAKNAIVVFRDLGLVTS